ncbi:hypothetical protein GHJ49_00045 [Alistipes sp. dk3620]|nr:hypothetical protein [Alistipes sp. dk3620]QGA23492.1 hypothetical protein GFH31_06415 [Alistipes sp. dk3624]RHO70774.1 hypothetical protein DW082_06320 [Alistipes sp. AF48-12]HAY31349.1 hypothetical protein [Alistipes sp.]
MGVPQRQEHAVDAGRIRRGCGRFRRFPMYGSRPGRTGERAQRQKKGGTQKRGRERIIASRLREEVPMEKKYKYRYDRRCRRITAALLLILAGLFVWFHFVLGGDYLPAWGLFFVVCIITLYILSIPRYILLDDAALEIHCIVDLTRIHIEDIELIRRIERSEFRRLWPLLGSYGFWGYYGYYFSFREWTLYKVYAAERNNLVLIEDIYEDTYIVSCDDPDGLIAFVSEARDRKRAEILRHTAGQIAK